MISLYIHIPFCKSKCKYCSFYSVADKRSSYLSALLKCIDYYSKAQNRTVSTVYIGGGTPSVLTCDEISALMEGIYQKFNVSDDAEITIECNPESVSEEFLKTVKFNKINRLSIGIQSFENAELFSVGRLHDEAAAKKAIENAKKQGFENISCDIIFGLPNQTRNSLLKSVKTLVDYDIPHISCYNLQVEKGTPLYSENTEVPNEEIQQKMYYDICAYLKDNGYGHYEISNFAKKGFESRHNSSYWTGTDYLGLGPSAHSKIGDVRCSFDSDVDAFINRQGFDFDYKEEITDPFFEKVMLYLRTDKGIDLSLLPNSARYIDKLCKCGFATAENGKLKLTDKGFYLSNTIISDIIAKEC